MHCLCKVLDVGRRNACDRDSAVLGEVDGVVFGHLCDLLLGEASEAEHTNLVSNVVPVQGGAVLLEVALELGSHGDDSVGHALDFAHPFFTEVGVAHDGGGDAGAVDWRVGVHWSDEDLELRLDSLGFFLVCAHDSKSTDSFAVHAHILGKRLAQDWVVAVGDKGTQRGGVKVAVTGRKALVCHVKDREQALCLADGRELGPVLWFWVNAGRVVCAGVEEDNVTFVQPLQVRLHAVPVKAVGGWVVVLVENWFDARVSHDWQVVAPGWLWHVDLLLALVRVELGQVFAADTEGTGAGDGLDCDRLFVLIS